MRVGTFCYLVLLFLLLLLLVGFNEVLLPFSLFF